MLRCFYVQIFKIITIFEFYFKSLIIKYLWFCIMPLTFCFLIFLLVEA